MIPGVGGALGGLLSRIPGAGAVGGALGGLVSGGGSDGQGNFGMLGDLGGRAGGLLGMGGSGGGSNLLGMGLAGMQVANAAEAGRKADKFANYGFDTINQNWLANAPLRDQGREGLLNPSQPNMSGLDAIRGALPGGLPQGAQALSGASSALGGGGLAGPGQSAPLPRPEGGLAGQGPAGATQPQPTTGFAARPGLRPMVRY
jgi:hypothetical protein